MKILFRIVAVYSLFICASCVDDYTAANPKGRKDGPAIYVYNPDNAVTSTRNDGSVITYVTKGEDALFEVTVVDAPGIIDSANTYLSDTVGIARVGTNFDALVGKETGTFTVAYTPEPNDPASTFDDRVVSLNVTVTDAQGKTTQPSTKSVQAIACVPDFDLTGYWRAVASGVTSEAFVDESVDAGGNYSNLSSLIRFQIRTTGGNATVGTNASRENAGVVFLPDASFGVYGKQGFAAPSGRLTVCGNSISSYQGLNSGGTAFASQGGHAITGTLNANGTITLNWTNTYGDTGTVTLTRATF